MIIECECARATYDDEKFSSCYQCYLDRADTMLGCIYCSRWHSPKYAMCYRCREERGPQGDSAARDLRMDVLLRDGFTCYLCGSHDMPQVDHIKPVRHGGSYEPWNLAVLCRTCNMDKVKESRYDERHRAKRSELMRTYLTYGWHWLSLDDRNALCQQALHEDKILGPFAGFSRFRESLGAAMIFRDPPQWAQEYADMQYADMDIADGTTT